MPSEMVAATIQEVTRNDQGWFKIKTSAGVFDTKYPERAQEAVALVGEETRLFFTEDTRPQNINPHTGQPYKPTRYYDRAERIAAAAVGNGGGIPGVKPEPAPQRSRTAPEDAWRMALTSGTERAVQTLPLLPEHERDFDSQKTIALAWARFIFFTPAPDLALEQPPPFAGIEVLKDLSAAHGYESPPPHTDDDIPY